MTEIINPQVQSFLNFLKYEKRYSVHTIISYQSDLADFFVYIERQFGQTKLDEIKHSFIRSWLAALKEKGISSKSINRKISSLKSFFKYLLRTDQINSSPTANIIAPKIGKRLPVFIKEADSKKLIETLSQSTEDWKTLNAKMLITILYATGMRLSELINLKEKQIDFSKSQIKVLGKGNKERIIPVSKDLLDGIKGYQKLKRKDFEIMYCNWRFKHYETTTDTLLITEKGNKIYPKYAYLLVNKFLTFASTLDKKSPHILRHTFATHLMNNGADLNAVKDLLGHSSLASTQVYTHNTIEKLKDIHKKAHPKA